MARLQAELDGARAELAELQAEVRLGLGLGLGQDEHGSTVSPDTLSSGKGGPMTAVIAAQHTTVGCHSIASALLMCLPTNLTALCS